MPYSMRFQPPDLEIRGVKNGRRSHIERLVAPAGSGANGARPLEPLARPVQRPA